MKSTLILALLSVSSLGACIDQQDTPSDDVSADPRLATNSMLPSVISPTAIYAAPLTGVALANSGLEASAGGRSYLSYIIDCALQTGQSVTSNYQLSHYTYPGNIGIAPAWTTRALTLQEMRYISSCVLARANYFGQAVTISMRADAAGFATTPDEAANYNVEEGAFYGNIFATLGHQLHACNGVDQVRDGDTYGDLPLRQCAQEDPNNLGYTLCGFVFDGNCADVCVVNGDHYTTCNSQTEVITSRLYGTAP